MTDVPHTATSRRTFRADWVLPIAGEAMSDAWVDVAGGRIVKIGSGPASDAVDLGRAAILPSLVNAHTHLELSYLRGAVPPAERFVDWIRRLMAERRMFADPRDRPILEGARTAIAEALESGTGLLGDISNTLVTVSLLLDSGMPARVFHELLGFNVEDAAGRVARARAAVGEWRGQPVKMSLAPHAPYSVAPVLFAAIRGDLDAHPDDVSTVHLAESADEMEFVAQGTGAWREVLSELGVWTGVWRPAGTSPVRYLANLGFLDSRVLAVHAVQCSRDDLDLLRARGATVVSCPRSNRHVGVGSPPLELFYGSGVSVAFGTDSLASVADLNLFSELAEARLLAPRVPARSLLESATLNGARALGFGADYGSIEPGKRASLIAVRIPPDVTGVEEYLVSGIRPADVLWLGDR